MISASFRYPADAYHWALGIIDNNGSQVITEDGQMTKELCNLCISIERPLVGWPIAGSGWNMEGLEKYAEQLMNPEKIGFDYTYGNRLMARESVFDDPDTCVSVMEWNQINLIVAKLKRHQESRRCVAITWYPERDILADHAPCLQLLEFLIRGGKLQCTAVFRSHDIARAWPCNVYGIGRLMQQVADEVGVPVGSLTTFSVSAHIYER
jgi:thymidylate synthase